MAFSRPVKVLILCVLWYSLSTTNNIIGKRILQRFQYPLTISLFHMLANSFLMYPVLMMVGLNTRYHFSRHFLWRFAIPLGIGKLLGSIFSHISIWRVSVSYAHTVKASLPIFTVFLGSCIYGYHQSTRVYLSLLPIVAGVAVATVTELSFEIYGMLSACFATFIFSVQNLYSKAALKEVRLNPLQMLVKISQVSLCVCVPLWLFVDTPVMLTDINLRTTDEKLDFFWRLSLSGFINFLQNVVAFSVLNILSPLSYSVANATKRVLIITVSLLTLRNPVTTTNFCGMMLAVVGVFLYNRAKISQNRELSILPSKTTDKLHENRAQPLENEFVSSRYRAFHHTNSFI